MSLQRLPPDRALAKREASQADDNSISPAESYTRQVLSQGWRQGWGHFGVKPIASTFAALLIAWFKTGSFWTAGVWAFAAFAAFMILAILFETLLAPRALDKASQEEKERLTEHISLLQEEIIELTKNQLTFEVLTEIWNSKVSLDDLGDTEDYRDATTFFLTAELFLRFYNDDLNPVRLRDISLAMITTAGSVQPLTFLNKLNMKEPEKEQTYFTPFVLAGKEQTKPIFFRFFVEVPRECALSVDKNSFLRVTIKAGTQDPYSVDVNVPWRSARKGATDVRIRPSESAE